jgi:hypothetical protein
MRTMHFALSLMVAAGMAMVAACDPVLDGDPAPEGIEFTYSGAQDGSFSSVGTVSSPAEGLPVPESFAMAQRDSIGGLLLGSFRRTGTGRGDLLILQLGDTDPGEYGCLATTEGSTCYGHLFIGVEAAGGTAAAEAVYTISAGQVVLNSVAEDRVQGTFEWTLRDPTDVSSTVTVVNGSIDVPLVEGVFDASFDCLVTRLQEGPGAPCD